MDGNRWLPQPAAMRHHRQHAVRRGLAVTTVIIIIIALLAFGSGAVPSFAADPISVDGLIDGAYQQVYNDGSATFYYYAGESKFYFALLNKPNENVFGPNPGAYHSRYQTGWNNHTFGHLINSDHVKVRISCVTGGAATQSVDLGLDYLYQSGGGWAAGLGGPDSIPPSGATALLSGLQASSSLVWDLSNQSAHGWDYTMGGKPQSEWQSPPFTPTYPALGPYSAWEMRSIYEFAFDRAPFVTAGCGQVAVSLNDVHNSPPKYGDPSYTVPPLPISNATPTPTNTPDPPTATPTNTPIAPTATATNTVAPPAATPTNTPVPPAPTPTNTPVPATSAPAPASEPAPTPTAPPAPVVAQVVVEPTPQPTVVAAATAAPDPTPVVVLAPASLPRAGGLPLQPAALSLLAIALVTLGAAARRFIR